MATDEDGNLFTTYTDDEGKLIMERRGNTRYPSVCRRELYPYMQAHTGTVMTDWEGLQQAADMREAIQVLQTVGARGG